MLLTGTVVSAAFAVRARKAEREANEAGGIARQEADSAKAISAFLENDLLRGGLKSVDQPNMSLREALDRAATAVDVRTYEDPLVEAKVHSVVGLAYRSINEQTAAKHHLQQAHDLRTRHLGAKHRDTLQAAFDLTVAKAAYDRSSMSTDAERAELAVGDFEQLLESQKSVLGSSDPDSLSTMGYVAMCYGRCGRQEEAELLFEKANRGFESAVGPRDARAIRCLKQSIECLRAIGNADRADELKSRYDSQMHVTDVEKHEAAASRVIEAERIVEQSQNDYGANAPETIRALERLGDALVESNSGQEAERVFQQVLSAFIERFGSDHEETCRIKRKLGQLCVRLYKLQPAVDYLTETVGDPKVDGTTLQTLRVIANMMKIKGQFAEAAEVHKTLAEAQTRLFGKTDARAIGSIHDEGLAYALMKHVSGLEQTIDELKSRVGSHHKATISCESHLGKLLFLNDHPDKAVLLLAELFQRSQRSLGEEDGLTLTVGHVLAQSQSKLGQEEQAIALARECLAKCENGLGERHLQTMLTLMLLGDWLIDTKDAEEAKDFLERAIAIEPDLRGVRRQRLGWLKQLATVTNKASDVGRPSDVDQHRSLLTRLVELAEKLNQQEDASFWSEKLAGLPETD